MEKKVLKNPKAKEDNNNAHEFEVALSYAREDEEYVEKVANFLLNKDIWLFYDQDKEAELWGEDLHDYLDDVYRNKSKYCMLFISKHYKEKIWTNHERKSALSRALKEKSPYILPVRLDDTEIEGLRDTIRYIDGRIHEPEQIGAIFLKKLGKSDIITRENLKTKIIKEENLPSVVFNLDPVQIIKGQSATLSWEVENASHPLIIENFHEKGGKGAYNFGETYKGHYSVHPSGNVTYKLVAKNLFGAVSGTIKLTVFSSDLFIVRNTTVYAWHFALIVFL